VGYAAKVDRQRRSSVLVLTGGPAVGKSTIAAQVALLRERCAVIDVDDVRQMVRNPHLAPWDGKEGDLQRRLGVLNACSLAGNFVRDRYDVLVLDVLTDQTAALYRQILSDLAPSVIVQLTAQKPEIERRASTRPTYLTEEEFEMLHRQQASFSGADVVLDTTALDTSRSAERLVGVFDSLRGSN
jgi:predicted kinase